MHLREMRERAGMTQLELARKVGAKNSSSISHYEIGRRKLNADQMPVFARALGCSIAELYGEEAADISDGASLGGEVQNG